MTSENVRLQDALNKAKDDFRSLRYEDARKEIDVALHIDSNNIQALRLKALYFRHIQNYAEEIACLNKMLDIEPNNIELWKLKGLVLGNQKNFESSLDSFDHALKIDASDASIWRMKSAVLFDLGKIKEALEAADKAIQLNSNDGLAWEVKGRCLYYQRHYIQSLEAFKNASPLIPAGSLIGEMVEVVDDKDTKFKTEKSHNLNKFISKGQKDWTIAVKENGKMPARKITKIISLSDGGFSVLTPYHNAKTGYLFKMPINPKDMMAQSFVTPWGSINGYIASSHAKLSYHWDGFAQFSSEKRGEIISGRDPVTRQPKGLGIMTRPLSQPIWSGGSIGITLWGINDFEPLKDSDRALIFEPRHFYYRGCSPDIANGYHLAIYVFPAGVMPPCHWDAGHFLLDVSLEPLNLPLVSVTRMSILTLPEKGLLLGILLNRIVVNFPYPSGWQINGPGDYSIEKSGYNLQAIYPILQAFPKGKSETIDYHKTT